MLRGENFEDASSPPPDPPAAGKRRQLKRFPDTITAPNAHAWRSREGDVDPEDWLEVAQWEWLGALRSSEMAPPDEWFAGRLQHIAEAAARKADALALFPAEEEMRWENEPDGLGLTLSYELRPGGNRPGPPELWAAFDSAVGRLGLAMRAGQAGLLRRSLEELSVALHDIADSLDRYRGRYGNWEELAPSDAIDDDASDEPTDTAEAVE